MSPTSCSRDDTATTSSSYGLASCSAICTVGAGLDYAGFLSEQIPKGTMASILATFPRLQMKRQWKDCLIGIVRARPQTTYENFVRDFGERFVPGYKPSISTVDLLENAPFDE